MTKDSKMEEYVKRRLLDLSTVGSFLAFEMKDLAADQDRYITGMSFKEREDDWMMVVKSIAHESVKEVAFFSGENPAQCIVGFRGKFYNGKVVWREDKPWKP